VTFAARGQWLVFAEPVNEANAWPVLRGLGEPGLWKLARNGVPPHRVFEIPSWVVSDRPDDDRLDESGPAPFAKLVDWAWETRASRVPAGWTAPAADLVQSWMPRGTLTVQAKGYVRQGELLLNDDHWALRMPILPRLTDDLPEPRRRALEELLTEAQRHWAMARLGVPADTTPAALVAEVDFTGAPHAELLFSAGLDVLRHLVAWLVETADVLADPAIALQSLAPGDNNNPTERKTP
jgi:hypothetical protein